MKIIRIYLLEVRSKAEAWRWLRQATPEDLEKILDFQTVKEIESDGGWFGTLVKQVTGK